MGAESLEHTCVLALWPPNYFKVDGQSFLRRLGRVSCRGQPTSLHIRHPSSYVIYNVCAHASNLNEDVTCPQCEEASFVDTNKQITVGEIEFEWRYVKSVSKSTNKSLGVPLGASHQNPFCSFHPLPLVMLFPPRWRPLWVTADLSKFRVLFERVQLRANLTRQPDRLGSKSEFWQNLIYLIFSRSENDMTNQNSLGE